MSHFLRRLFEKKKLSYLGFLPETDSINSAQDIWSRNVAKNVKISVQAQKKGWISMKIWGLSIYSDYS